MSPPFAGSKNKPSKKITRNRKQNSAFSEIHGVIFQKLELLCENLTFDENLVLGRQAKF
jgi:hypothetical protein